MLCEALWYLFLLFSFVYIYLADRAKAIKTKAVVNESPTDKLIRELREENAKLLAKLKAAGGDPEALAKIVAEQGGGDDGDDDGGGGEKGGIDEAGWFKDNYYTFSHLLT